jgi:hypothetical protein
MIVSEVKSPSIFRACIIAVPRQDSHGKRYRTNRETNAFSVTLTILTGDATAAGRSPWSA